MTVSFISPYIATKPREFSIALAEYELAREQRIADARWHWQRHRDDMRDAERHLSEFLQPESRRFWRDRWHKAINYMGYWRREMLRHQVGDERYFEMSRARRMQRRLRLWNGAE